jgi:hypothetical protein
MKIFDLTMGAVSSQSCTRSRTRWCMSAWEELNYASFTDVGPEVHGKDS